MDHSISKLAGNRLKLKNLRKYLEQPFSFSCSCLILIPFVTLCRKMLKSSAGKGQRWPLPALLFSIFLHQVTNGIRIRQLQLNEKGCSKYFRNSNNYFK